MTIKKLADLWRRFAPVPVATRIEPTLFEHDEVSVEDGGDKVQPEAPAVPAPPAMRTQVLHLPVSVRDYQLHYENQVLERFHARLLEFLKMVEGLEAPEVTWNRMKNGCYADHDVELADYYALVDTYREGQSHTDRVMTYQMGEIDNAREGVFEDGSKPRLMHVVSTAAGVAQVRTLIAMSESMVVDAGERMRWLVSQLAQRITAARRLLARCLLDRLEDRGCGRPSMVGIEMLMNEKSNLPPRWQIVIKARDEA